MKRTIRTLSLFLTMAVMLTAFSFGVTVNAATASLSYAFSGSQATKAGYAQGTVTFTAGDSGTYRLYWADDEKALEGYSRIAKFELSSGKSDSVTFGYHTVIPAGATKIIACKDSDTTVSQAKAVYDIPQSKQLYYGSGDLLYTFSAYSDIHLDKGSRWYKDAETHLGEGLQYAADKGSDYLVVTGDVCTNDPTADLNKEWNTFESILAESEYVNPVWESVGNHDLRQGVSYGLKTFIKHTGTDSTKENYDANLPYFYKVEEKTGDLFLFMALDLSKETATEEMFSNDQLDWAEALINEYTAKGVNVFILQHAPIKGFGAGDDMSDPYYSGLLRDKFSSVARFKSFITNNKKVVWLSGHTHEDFVMDYNYSNEGGDAGNMLHIPSLAGSTMPDEEKHELLRNEGHGYNSQGYFAEVYENKIVFYGVKVSDGTIYPLYSYIMDSIREEDGVITNTEEEVQSTGTIVSISSKISEAYQALGTYSLYASYDQYQALKKLYNTYKSQTSADSSVITLIDNAIAELKDIAEHTGMPKTYPVGSEYYFENNKSWSKVYAYAWTGSVHNAEWPGVQISKSGTSNGHDVYKVQFDSAGQYQNLIFTDGSSQTVDIGLAYYKYNAFRLNSTTNGKYEVTNFSLESGVEEGQVALLYYVSGVHDWTDTNTLMTQKEDGTFEISLTSTCSENISLSLYDKITKKYKSLSASASVTYAEGLNQEFALETYDARGKSITINGLSKGNVIHLAFDPKTNKLTLTTDSPVSELINNSTISAESVILGESVNIIAAAEGGTGSYQYAMYYKETSSSSWNVLQDYSTTNSAVFQPAAAVSYDISVNVKDSQNTVKEKSFTVQVQQKLTNTSEISDQTIRAGGTVTVNASAEGGSGDYQYAVCVKKASTGTWTTSQAYSSNQTVSLRLASAEKHEICVKAKDSSGTVAKKYFTVTVQPKLKNTSVISATTVQVGGKVTVTSSAEGGTGDYQYAVFVKRSSKDTWSTSQAYSSNQTVTVKMSYEEPYEICVKAKDSEGTVAKVYFTVTVQAKLKNTTVLSADSINRGEKVTVNASAEGGTGDYQYAVFYKKTASEKWSTAQAYSTNSTITIKPGASTTYNICVKVRDSSGTVVRDYYTVSVK